MSRQAFKLLLLALFVGLACHTRADRQPYGSYLSEILGVIVQNYVEPVDEQRLFEGAVNGMLGQLDEHSAFITRDDMTELRESLEQEFGGIGIEVTLDPKTKQLTVLTPLVGTPAHAAGIRPGDQILAIDGKPTTDFKLGDAVKRMRGKPGAPVTLRLQRLGEPKPFELTLNRAEIAVESVRGDRRLPDGSWSFLLEGDPQVGYLRIVNFGERTAEEVAGALQSLQLQGANRLVLDLRDNPGGLLTAAVGVSEQFLAPGQEIVTTRGRDGRINDKEKYVAAADIPRCQLPLAVLVNRFSASASEIVAAALQDHGRAIIVGERTFGKGTVQRMHPVEAGKGILKLTTASYWRPSGQNIHRRATSKETDPWGVTPNAGLTLKLSDEETTTWYQRRRTRDILPSSTHAPRPNILTNSSPTLDPQLQKAVESLRTSE